MGLFARTKSMALISVLVAVVSVALFGFLVDRIFRLNRAAAQLATDIQTESERDEQLRSLGKLLEQLESEETALDIRFVDTEGIVPFIESVERMGVDAGIAVEVASVSIDPDTDTNRPHEWLKISLWAQGSWSKLFHFLMLLETVPYAVKLDQVGLTWEESDAVSSGGQWEGTFIIRAAKLKQP